MGGRREEVLLSRRDVADPAHLREVAGHEGKRLILAHLAAPQGANSLRVEWVAGQVVAAEPLDGDDGPAAQHPRRPRDGVTGPGVKFVPEPVEKPYPRAADGTGVGLGVEAAALWGGVITPLVP